MKKKKFDDFTITDYFDIWRYCKLSDDEIFKLSPEELEDKFEEAEKCKLRIKDVLEYIKSTCIGG